MDLSVKKGTISNVNSTVINNNANQLLTYRKVEEVSSTPQINTLADSKRRGISVGFIGWNKDMDEC